MTETPVTLLLWLQDGAALLGNDPEAPRVSYPAVSVGRTDSKRLLGITVRMTARAPLMCVALDAVQVTNLRDHLTYQLGRLKPRRSPRRTRSPQRRRSRP